jgi:hypothetical protein
MIEWVQRNAIDIKSKKRTLIRDVYVVGNDDNRWYTEAFYKIFGITRFNWYYKIDKEGLLVKWLNYLEYHGKNLSLMI